MPITWRDRSDDDYQPTSAEESQLSEKWARDDQWEAYREELDREFPKRSQEGGEEVTASARVERERFPYDNLGWFTHIGEEGSRHVTDTTYNGWASYETWAANLELCEDICRMWEEDKQTFGSVYDLSEALKTYVWELFEETDSQIGCLGDVFGWFKEPSVLYTWAMRSLENVNWYEIAEHYPDLIVSEEAEAQAGV